MVLFQLLTVLMLSLTVSDQQIWEILNLIVILSRSSTRRWMTILELLHPLRLFSMLSVKLTVIWTRTTLTKLQVQVAQLRLS